MHLSVLSVAGGYGKRNGFQLMMKAFMGTDLSFSDWLFGKISPMEDQLAGDDFYWGSLLGCMEMISNPALFILDEPDSGLDGVMARALFEQLRRIADTGRIVIVITHTPVQALSHPLLQHLISTLPLPSCEAIYCLFFM